MHLDGNHRVGTLLRRSDAKEFLLNPYTYTRRSAPSHCSHNFQAVLRKESTVALFNCSIVSNGSMYRGFSALLLVVLLALHAAIPARACPSVDMQNKSDLVYSDIGNHSLRSSLDVNTSAPTDICPHDVPCQEHCNWLASLSFPDFQPVEPAVPPSISKQLLAISLTVAVPPPK